MKIISIPCGPISTNSYIVHDSNQALLIDPAEFQPIWAMLQKEHLEISSILLTHGHFDHMLAVPELRRALPKIPVYIHAEDTALLYDGNLNGSATFARYCALSENENTLPLGEDLTTPLGNIKIIHTPGHTPGSVIFKMEEHIFTGDFIFQESIGRTDFSRGSPKDMQISLRRFVEKFQDHASTISLYPGHGNMTTLEHELQFNPFLDRITKHMGQ